MLHPLRHHAAIAWALTVNRELILRLCETRGGGEPAKCFAQDRPVIRKTPFVRRVLEGYGLTLGLAGHQSACRPPQSRHCGGANMVREVSQGKARGASPRAPCIIKMTRVTRGIRRAGPTACCVQLNSAGCPNAFANANAASVCLLND